MHFDRKVFFNQYRRYFGELRQEQVDGLNRLLTGFETYYGWWDDHRQIANALAQVGRETNYSYTPVVEAYYLGDPNRPGYYQGNTDRVRAVQRTFWYWPHIGRGDIQCTHADNYQKADAYIRKYFPERVTDFEQRTGQKFDLIHHPEQMFDGWISFCTFTVGMHLGTFRKGHNLDRYINPIECDHYGAREIVNGDKARVMPRETVSIGRQIEAMAKKFEKILGAAMIDDASFLSGTEIDNLTNEIGPSSTVTDSAESQSSLLSEPAYKPVGSPEPGADGSPSVNGNGEPLGDAPDAEPSSWLSVEDWKGFCLRWLRRIWGVGITGNVAQASAFVGAAVKDPEHGHIYLGIGASVFIIIAVIGLLLTAGLVGLLWWNRKEIGHYITEQWRTKMDPTRKNFGLIFEKK